MCGWRLCSDHYSTDGRKFQSIEFSRGTVSGDMDHPWFRGLVYLLKIPTTFSPAELDLVGRCPFALLEPLPPIRGDTVPTVEKGAKTYDNY